MASSSARFIDLTNNRSDTINGSSRRYLAGNARLSGC
jgi:hypothetical protein